MNRYCYEITEYKLRQGSDPDAYLAAVEKLNELLPGIEGFVKRDVFYREETQHWVEVIAWKDEASAKRAVETLMVHPVCKEGFAPIDMEAVTLAHYERKSSVNAAASL